jgi:hypothetical protein
VIGTGSPSALRLAGSLQAQIKLALGDRSPVAVR